MVFLQPERLRPIFVGGIHGVGKSTLVAQICSELNLSHVIAGDVISKFKERRNIRDLDSAKRATDIAANQDVLVSALSELSFAHSPYILDGHYTLLNAHGVIRPIPLSTFKQIAPLCLLLITDKPELIQSRLMQRDGQTIDSSTLGKMQRAEMSHANSVARHLRIELHKIPLTSSRAIKDIIRTCIDKCL